MLSNHEKLELVLELVPLLLQSGLATSQEDAEKIAQTVAPIPVELLYGYAGLPMGCRCEVQVPLRENEIGGHVFVLHGEDPELELNHPGYWFLRAGYYEKIEKDPRYEGDYNELWEMWDPKSPRWIDQLQFQCTPSLEAEYRKEING